ncbi:MAG: hypothetical protein AVDCRST_MAG11-467, partial [uncultured Gemmatimonadaceae bacterium]
DDPRDHDHEPGRADRRGDAHGRRPRDRAAARQRHLPRLGRRAVVAAHEPRPAGRDRAAAHEGGARGAHPPQLHPLLAPLLPHPAGERVGAAR